MRLLLTADAVGGVWTYALDLAQGLLGAGDSVALATLGPALTPDQRAQADAVPSLVLVETGLPLDWTAETPHAIAAAGQTLSALADAQGADFVHLNSPSLAATGLFQQKLIIGCHSCVSTWWAAVRGTPLPDDFVWRADLTRRGYGAADALIAPSVAFANDTQRAYALTRRPRVAHNGRDWPAFAVSASLRERPSRAVLTAGRLWDEGKNCETLDRAAARVDAPVFAAGALAGPNDAIISFNRMVSLGTLPSAVLAERMAERPIYASLALYEPFGLAVLEAAQAGCALVLSDVPSFRELWEGCALFVPARDADAAAEAVNNVLADPDRQHALGLQARERARRYSREAMVRSHQAIYRSIGRDVGAAP